jgi:lysophospholipase L1-like esterase
MAQRRRLGTAAAYLGAAATAAGTLVAGVLGGQVLFARRTIPGAQAPPPNSGGRYGRQYEAEGAEPVRLAVLGDSTAAGYGVHTRAQTPGALLATAVATAAQRPVVLTCPAAVGSPSAWLPAQAETVVEATARAAGNEVPATERTLDLAVIFIGANDVTAGASAERAVGHLVQAVALLRQTGAEVIVATCPDLGVIRPILPPLRWVVRRWSRQLARAQRAGVEREGAHTVALGELLGPAFDADPQTMFGEDRYHPSAAGYRAAVDVVLPTVFRVLATMTPLPGIGAGAVPRATAGDEGGAAAPGMAPTTAADGAVPCVSETR